MTRMQAIPKDVMTNFQSITISTRIQFKITVTDNAINRNMHTVPLCLTVVHDAAYNRSDYLSSYRPSSFTLCSPFYNRLFNRLDETL